MANTTNFGVEKPTVGGYRNTWGGTLNTGFDKIDELLALAMPVGTIQMYPKTTAPVSTTNGGTWLVCDGASISRATYSALFAVIGTTYGSLDVNTFYLPDMRARSPLGYNTDSISGRATRALALGSGVETHALSTAELAAHSHAIPATTHDHDITDVTHEHVGSDSGKTGSASTSITIADHNHKTFGSDGYVVNPWFSDPNETISTGSGIDGDEFGTFKSGSQHLTGSSSTPITDPGHKHSFTTDSVGTGLTNNSTRSNRNNGNFPGYRVWYGT